jgi:uncharacterized protein
MRDGVRLAVDVYLPKGLKADARLPTIFIQTRYVRAIDKRWPLRRLIRGRFGAMIDAFVRHGYAWVYVDARGSGASFGSRQQPYGDEEIADARELLDWIVAQGWSNGKVGAWGSSYTGGSALRLAATGHPALKAIMPRFAMFDLYADAVFPGGLHLRWLTQTWSRLARALDSNRLQDFLGRRVKLATKGIAAVDEDPEKRLLDEAVAEHAANGDVATLVEGIVCRDDPSSAAPGLTLDHLSPHTRLQALKRSGIGMYFISGWMDAGFIRGQVHAYMNLAGPQTKLTIGPWDHGGYKNISPAARRKRPRFDHVAESLGFFDGYLKDPKEGTGEGAGFYDEAPVHYFTMVEEAWKRAPSWPPPGTVTRRLFLAPAGALSPEAPTLLATDAGSADPYLVDLEVGTGDRSRWDSLINLRHRRIRYRHRDRVRMGERSLVYQSAPLPADTEVTGHPLARLWLSADATDAAVFVYLEDVDPRGRVTYVTEGLLRAMHRGPASRPAPYKTVGPYRSCERADARPLRPGVPAELLVELLPTSYLFKAGHRVRIAIAGADRDHFAPLDPDPPLLHIHRSRAFPSLVELPVMSPPGENPKEKP